MPVTAAELRNLITGDDSSYQAAAKRTEASLASLQRQAAQATATVAASFNGFSAPINGASAAFSGLGNTITQTFNNAGAASQQASSVMSSALSGVQVAAAAVPASLGAIGTEAQAMGAAVTASGNGAAAALGPLNGAAATAAQGISGLGASAVSAGAGIGELAARKAVLLAQISNVDKAIRSETSVLAGAQSAVANLGGSHTALNNVVKDSETKLAGYIAQQAVLKGELGNVNNALKGTAAAQGVTAAATNVAGAATQEMGKKTGILSALMSTHTTQISSQGTAWKGYDNVIQAVIRSMGGIPIIWALAITVGGVLLEKLISMGSAKKKVADITDELIKSDVALIAMLEALQGSTNGVAIAAERQADSYRELLKTDLISITSNYANENKKLEITIKDITKVEQFRAFVQQKAQEIQAAGQPLNQQEQQHLSHLNGLVTLNTERIAASNSEREKQQQAISRNVEALITYRDATGQSTEAILNMARAAGASEGAIARLAAQMDAGAVAASRFASAWAAAAKAPTFDFSGTTHGLEKLFETATAGAQQAIGKFRNWGEEVSANEKNLKPLTSALNEYAKVQAAATGKTGDAATIASIARSKLTELASAQGYLGEKVLGSINLFEQSNKKVTEHGAAHRAATGHVKAHTEAITEQSIFLKQLGDAMKKIVDDITRKLNDIDIGKILSQKIAPTIKAMNDQLTELSSTIDTRVITSFDKLRDVTLRGDGSFEALINRMIDMKRASEVAAAAAKLLDEEFEALSDQFRDMSSSLPRAWNTIIDGILAGTGRLGTDLLKLGVKIKGFANDAINVFATMPGKWGDAFRRTLDEVDRWIDRWIDFIDSAIRLVERMLGSDSPNGLGGILSNVGEVFKQTTADVSQGAEDIAMGVGSASNSIGQFATQIQQDTTAVASSALKMLSSVGLAIGGLVSLFTGQSAGGLVGGIQGALSGAAAGFGLGSLIHGIFGTFLTSVLPGLGAAVFGIIGLIKGLFGGKSDAQKQQEKLQLEQLKISVQQSAQTVIDAAIQGFDRALAFFEHLEEFTAPRKRKFAQFWQAMTRLMNGFLELSKLWASESLTKAKEAAEAIGPIAEAISALPDAFSAINTHFGVAQSSIDRFFADFDKIMTAFFARSEIWIEGVSKRAKKVAQRLAPAVELIANFGTALTNIADVKEPSDEVFAIFDRVIDKILTHVVNLNLRFEKDVLKAMANFSEKAGSALALWSEGVNTFKEMVDIKMPTEADFVNVFAGIERAIKGMTDLAERLDTTALEKAQSIANASLAIFASIKAGVEALASLRDFTGVLPEVFTAFMDGFDHALTLLESMAGRAKQFDVISHTFESYIASGAASLAHAFTMLGQIVNAAGSFFPGGNPITVPVGGELGPTSAAAMGPTSFTIAPTSPTPTSSMTITIGSLTITADTPERMAALQAFINLFLPGMGIGAVADQHG